MTSARVELRLIPKSEQKSITLGQFASLLGNTERCLKASGTILHLDCPLQMRIQELGMGSLHVVFTAEAAGEHLPEHALEEVVSLFVEAMTPEEQVTPQVEALRRTGAFRNLARTSARSLDAVEINGYRTPTKWLRELASPNGKSRSPATVYLSVRGRLEAVDIHGRRVFRVYSPLGEATTCVFNQEMLELVKQLLGRWVVVRGIRRRSGGPVQVQKLELREAEGPSLLEMKGAWAGLFDEPSEVVIRKIRDEDED